MDTSKTYIEMCKKAGEIQEAWSRNKPQRGDFFVDEHLDPDGERKEIPVAYNGEPLTLSAIWLPRQDQLQEIAGRRLFDIASQCHFDDALGEYLFSMKTDEQLWIAYVMKRKCGKVWNGEDWIKS